MVFAAKRTVGVFVTAGAARGLPPVAAFAPLAIRAPDRGDRRGGRPRATADDGGNHRNYTLLGPPSIVGPLHPLPDWAAPLAEESPGRADGDANGRVRRSDHHERGEGRSRRVEHPEEKESRKPTRRDRKENAKKRRSVVRGDNNRNERGSDIAPDAKTIPPFSQGNKDNSKPAPFHSILDILASSIDPADPLFPSAPSSSLDDVDDFVWEDVTSAPGIEGVLPVSELFYQSTQSLLSSASDDAGAEGEGEGRTGDDRELPFSAEQSNQLSTSGHNKIHIRRNQAAAGDDRAAPAENVSAVVRRELQTMAAQEKAEQRQYEKSNPQLKATSKAGRKSKTSKASKKGDGHGNGNTGKHRAHQAASPPRPRRMVRRGMEMLVGGEPINADPPRRCVELYYRDGKLPPEQRAFRGVTTSSRDFGPLLHQGSAKRVTRAEQGLFCEHFVGVTRKWGICPRDLAELADAHEEQEKKRRAADKPAASVSKVDVEALTETSMSPSESGTDHGPGKDTGSQNIIESHVLDTPKGFGTRQKRRQRKRNTSSNQPGLKSRGSEDSGTGPSFTLGGELKFSLSLRRSDLEQSHTALGRVLARGISSAIGAEGMGFNVRISEVVIVGSNEGHPSTDVVVQFQLEPREPDMDIDWATRQAHKVNGALASAMDDGRMAVALAESAKEEQGWSEEIRDRFVEECLADLQDNENNGDKNKDRSSESSGDTEPNSNGSKYKNTKNNQYDGPFENIIYAKDDIWLGGGNGGAFFDYSKSNSMNLPYKGNLGPRLVDAAIERARQNQPRVIAIGDVHGCIDELKALLRKCDYHPGDLVVFLGDLVCKGPDSLSVVQLAREIGAIGVRGNHDFEVVRWHQAIKSGADPPLIGSEHYYVASALGTADLRWLYSLPWYVSSEHLNALFVHAGFVSGINLRKQNPRLMMNMRSILPDGTVTSKFFNNWPWARLWDGPQTVFFGHDADRGLQQYEHGIGLDTGCVYGGKLTACILPERRLVSVNAKQEYFQYRRKHFT